MKRSNTANRLKEYMLLKNCKQVDLLRMVTPWAKKYDIKINKSHISQYVSGTVEPKQDKIFVFARGLNVSEAWLMGFDVPMERDGGGISPPLTVHETDVITAYRDKPAVQPKVDELLEVEPMFNEPSNVLPLPTPFHLGRPVPVLGRVPAGIPIEAIPDVIDTAFLDERFNNDGHDYFALCVTGESMFPEYMDGDYVFIRQQQTADSGADVVAYVGDNEATFKRLYRDINGIELRPLNPAYPTLTFTNEDVINLPVTIAGVVVGMARQRNTYKLADGSLTQEAIDKFFAKKDDDKK